MVPLDPKFCTKPSAHPEMQRALDTMLAMKKMVPIEPPNSGPSVRLIITN